LKTQLAPLLTLLAPGYTPAVPTSTFTQTFAAGPVVVFRRIPHFAMFVHPSLGAVRELATPHPDDPLTTVAVSIFFTGKNTVDWKPFYGIGGGFDITPTKHFGLRMQTDVIWDELLDSLLSKGHWTIRASIGPSFHFGKNIAQ
jgi:hypothetical protein